MNPYDRILSSQARRRSVLLMLVLAFVSNGVSAQISFIGAATETSISSPTSSVTIDRPFGVIAGDVLLAQIVITSGTATITAPTGWALVRRDNNGGNLAQALYIRVAGATEPTTYMWSGWSGLRSGGGISAYRGVDASAPVSAHNGQASGASNSVIAPTVAVLANGWVTGFFAVDNGGSSFAAPGDMATRFSGGTGAGPNGVTIGSADRLQAVAGPSGDKTAVLAGSVVPHAGGLIALRPIAAALHHIRILHSGTAVTCEPTTVTLRACADAACSAESPTPVTVTLAPAGGWSSNPVGFTGNTTVSLSVITESAVALGASSSPAATNATQCFAGAVATCALSFADTGFIFTPAPIPTQTAGTASAAISLRAVRKADNSSTCTAALPAGTRSIQLASQCINPTTCAGRQVSISGAAIASNPASGVAAYTGVNLTFDANASASFTMTYPDVGALQLHARSTMPNGAVLVGSSNSFVVRPAGFAISAVQRVSDNFANPGATDATGPVFIGAGRPFRATVTAITSGGVATPNYGREIAPPGVQLTRTLLQPVAGAAPVLANGNVAGGSFSGGSAVAANLNWPEVGIINLRGSIANYLGAGGVTGAVSSAIGRFVPDHFDVTVSPGCLASSITYAGQPFTVGVVAAAAAAVGNSTTQNYAGTFARAARVSVQGNETGLTGNVLAASGFSAGIGSAQVSYRSPADPQPPQALQMRAIDSDGVSSATFLEGTTGMRSARLRLLNAVGSDLQPLAMPVQVESWQAVAGAPGVFAWSLDATDQCTTLSAANIAITSAIATLGAVVLTNGGGSVTLNPTGWGNADVRAVLNAPAPATPLAPWLQFNWDGSGDGSREDPTARAGFGLNPGSPRQIFRGEVVGGN